jgi:hypothetical protein
LKADIFVRYQYRSPDGQIGAFCKPTGSRLALDEYVAQRRAF